MPRKKQSKKSATVSPTVEKQTATLRVLKNEYVNGILHLAGETLKLPREEAFRQKRRIPEAFQVIE